VVPQWRHDNIVGGRGQRKEKGSFTGWTPFIAGRGGGRRAARRRNRGREMAVGSCGCGSRQRSWPRVVGALRTRSVRDSVRAADGWVQRF
jgi:hypothetical protein